MNCISGCAAVTQNVHIVLPKNSLNSKCGQGHIVSVALQGATHMLITNSIDSTSCVDQTPVES